MFFLWSVLSNVEKLAAQILSGSIETHEIPTFNWSNPKTVAIQDYTAWFQQHGNASAGTFTECDLEKEMQKVIKFALSFFCCFFFHADKS